MIKKHYSWLLDIFLPALLVCVFSFQPDFRHGLIDLWEVGAYLPFINEVLNGKIIFKDVMIFRGPLEVYAPAFFMLLFGKNISVLNAWFYFGNVLAIIFAVLVAQKILRTRFFLYLLIPIIVAKTFSLVYFKDWGGFRYACGFISVWCALNYLEKRKVSWLFFSGFFSALGFFFSVDMGVLPAVAIIITLCAFFPKKDFLKDFSRYLIGVLIVAVPFLLYFVFSGAIKGYLQNLLTIPRSGYTIYHFDILFPDMPHNPLEALKCVFKPFKHDFQYSLPIMVYLVVTTILIFRYIRHRFEQREILVFCAGLYGLFVYLGSFRQINGPQFQMSWQPALIFILFSAETWFIFFKDRQSARKNKLALKFEGLALFLFIFWLVFPSIFIIKNFLNYGLNMKKVVYRETSKGCFSPSDITGALDFARAKDVLVPAWQAKEINSVVNYIQKNTNPQEPVLCFPDEGAYNFLFDRPCLGRFCQVDIASYRQDWSDEFWAKLEARKPRYIIYKREVDIFEPLISQYPLVQNRVKLRSFIQDNYKIVGAFGSIDIYKLNPPGLKSGDSSPQQKSHPSSSSIPGLKAAG